ncbi:Anaphase-promoting complex subunit 8 [Dictyocoela muelleri]|nr:Anaphase-promoting complex subunit 8 [Dictyocoela muelleri]
MIKDLYQRCLFKSINHLSLLGTNSVLSITLSPVEVLAHSLFCAKDFFKVYNLLNCYSNSHFNDNLLNKSSIKGDLSFKKSNAPIDEYTLTCQCCPAHIQFLRIYSLIIHKKILNQNLNFKYQGNDPYLRYLSVLCMDNIKNKFLVLKDIVYKIPFFIDAIEELQLVIENIEELKVIEIPDKLIFDDFLMQMFIFRYMKTECIDKAIKNFLQYKELADKLNIKFDTNSKETLKTAEFLKIRENIGEYKLSENGEVSKKESTCQNNQTRDLSKSYIQLNKNLKEFATYYTKIRLAAIFYTLKDHLNAVTLFDSVPIYMTNFRDLHSNIYYINNDLRNLSILSFESRNCGYSPETMTIIGNFFSLRKDHPKAIQYYQKSIKLSSKFSMNYTLIGHEYLQLNNYPQALNNYSKSIEANCFDHRAYYGIASVYTTLNQHQQSVYFYRKCYEMKNDPFIINSYAIALNKVGDFEKSIEILKRGVELEDTDSILLMADLYKSKKMYVEAVEYYEMYVKKVKDEKIEDFLKEYYLRMGDRNE